MSDAGALQTRKERKSGRGANQHSKPDLQFTPFHMRHIQAKSLLDEGKTYAQVTAATGLSSATIAKIATGKIEILPSWVNSVKKFESQKLTVLAHQFLDAITPEKINSCSVPQLVTAAAIVIDKRRLIDGESTSNIAHAGLLATLEQDRRSLMSRLDALE